MRAADDGVVKLWRLVDDSNEAGATYSELLREQTLRAVDEAADEDLIKLWRLVDDSNEAGATYTRVAARPDATRGRRDGGRRRGEALAPGGRLERRRLHIQRVAARADATRGR